MERYSPLQFYEPASVEYYYSSKKLPPLLFTNKLVIVFTRVAPAFEDLFNTCIWFLRDINTVHTNFKKETFEYLLKLTSM